MKLGIISIFFGLVILLSGAVGYASDFNAILVNDPVTGSEMTGLKVTAYYDSGISKTAYWAPTGGDSGKAQVYSWFKLTQQGDTFSGSWELTNYNTSHRLIALELEGWDAGIAFDVRNDENYTEGSLLGQLQYSQGNCIFSDNVTYRGEPTIDLYATINFELEHELWWHGTFSFVLDSDRITANQMPIASPQTVTSNEDEPVVITLSATDPEEDPLTYEIASNPSHGALSGSGPNQTYTPEENFNGIDSFTFKANDGYSDSNEAAVEISVTPVNDRPIANNDAYSVDEGSTLDVSSPGVITNDSDVEENPLTAALVSTSSHGDLTLSGDGSFTYFPTSSFFQTDTFTYLVNDGLLDSTPATVTIAINLSGLDYSGDGDGLPDSWEMNYFGNLNQGPDDDPDGDQLTNLQEYLLGTDPTQQNLDTDNDGLPDWYELQQFGNLDQQGNADSDGDGVTNYVEYLSGNDPNDAGDFPSRGVYYEYDELGRIKKIIRIK